MGRSGPMTKRRRLPFLILAVAVLLPYLLIAAWVWLRAATGPPGKLDPADLGGYMRKLYRSWTPEAAVLRGVIENGPRDLAREQQAATQDGIPIVPGQLQR